MEGINLELFWKHNLLYDNQIVTPPVTKEVVVIHIAKKKEYFDFILLAKVIELESDSKEFLFATFGKRIRGKSRGEGLV